MRCSVSNHEDFCFVLGRSSLWIILGPLLSTHKMKPVLSQLSIEHLDGIEHLDDIVVPKHPAYVMTWRKVTSQLQHQDLQEVHTSDPIPTLVLLQNSFPSPPFVRPFLIMFLNLGLNPYTSFCLPFHISFTSIASHYLTCHSLPSYQWCPLVLSYSPPIFLDFCPTPLDMDSPLFSFHTDFELQTLSYISTTPVYFLSLNLNLSSK